MIPNRPKVSFRSVLLCAKTTPPSSALKLEPELAPPNASAGREWPHRPSGGPGPISARRPSLASTTLDDLTTSCDPFFSV